MRNSASIFQEKHEKDRKQRRIIAGCLILAAIAFSAYGIAEWRNFDYLLQEGIEADAKFSDVTRSRSPSTTVTIAFVTASNEQVTNRCNVTNQFYFHRIQHADLANTRFKIKYCRRAPRNFLVVDGTDPEIDALFFFSGFLCFIAVIAMLPPPPRKTITKANNPMDRSGGSAAS